MTGIVYHDGGNDNPVNFVKHISEEAKELEASYELGSTDFKLPFPQYAHKEEFDALVEKFNKLEEKFIALGIEKVFDDSDENKLRLIQQFEENLKKIEEVMSHEVLFKKEKVNNV
jgi:hypothetical protein